jgi:two-component system LytT family response regulator
MKKYKAIIIDDEYPARVMVKDLAAPHKDSLDIIAEAGSGREAIVLIDELLPDVIFLDITLPDMTGFDMLLKIRHQPFIIFTTAYEHYAIRAFETNSIDYLVKPIEESRFGKSIQKLQRLSGAPGPMHIAQLAHFFLELKQPTKATALPIKTGDKIILLKFGDVVYIEAKEKYVFVVTGDKKEYLSDTRLSEFEEILPANFIRVQKSFIINKDKILEIHKHFGNRLILIMDDKNRTRIRSGVTYIHQIRSNLGL